MFALTALPIIIIIAFENLASFVQRFAWDSAGLFEAAVEVGVVYQSANWAFAAHVLANDWNDARD